MITPPSYPISSPLKGIPFRAHLELGEERQDDLGVVGVAEDALEVVQVPRHQAVGPGQALQAPQT